MMLQRWYPTANIRRIEDRMNRVWGNFGRSEFPRLGEIGSGVPVDLEEEGDNIVIRASLPGVRPEDIHVTTEDGVLKIWAETVSESETKESEYLLRERSRGSFHRALRLPESVDPDKAESTYQHGVLTVTLPKQEAKKAKELEIKVSS